MHIGSSITQKPLRKKEDGCQACRRQWCSLSIHIVCDPDNASDRNVSGFGIDQQLISIGREYSNYNWSASAATLHSVCAERNWTAAKSSSKETLQSSTHELHTMKFMVWTERFYAWASIWWPAASLQSLGSACRVHCAQYKHSVILLQLYAQFRSILGL